MKKKASVYVISILVAIVAASCLISFQFMNNRKHVEENAIAMQEKLAYSVIKNGYDRYVAGNHKDFTDAVNELNGSQLTTDESYEQLKCFITNMSEGVNDNKVESRLLGGNVINDYHLYYDSEMNSMMKENTLMIVKKNRSDNTDESNKEASKVRIYYTFNDDEFADKMQSIIEVYGSRIGTVVFHVENAYIKGHEFVPGKVSCYAIGEGGNITDEKELFVCPDDMGVMINNGYELHAVDDEFLIGDINDSMTNDYFAVYCSTPAASDTARIDQLINDNIDKLKENGDDRLLVKNYQGFLNTEMFSVMKCAPEGSDDLFYAVVYEKRNALLNIVDDSIYGGRGMTNVIIYILEMIAAIVIGILIAGAKTRKIR